MNHHCRGTSKIAHLIDGPSMQGAEECCKELLHRKEGRFFVKINRFPAAFFCKGSSFLL